jgi:hypothetical protein
VSNSVPHLVRKNHRDVCFTLRAISDPVEQLGTGQLRTFVRYTKLVNRVTIRSLLEVL